jgi:opacity protein-like surface antigen
MLNRRHSRCVPIVLVLLATVTSSAMAQAVSYRLLATTKTSTMQKEMNEAADAGYRFGGVMGGDTAFGGGEVLAIMVRMPEVAPKYAYRLLATSKTSTMQKEMQEAGDAGFEYRGQTVFGSTFGGEEVVVILERDKHETPKQFEYRLLATAKTGTMQKELQWRATRASSLSASQWPRRGWAGVKSSLSRGERGVEHWPPAS